MWLDLAEWIIEPNRAQRHSQLRRAVLVPPGLKFRQLTDHFGSIGGLQKFETKVIDYAPARTQIHQVHFWNGRPCRNQGRRTKKNHTRQDRMQRGIPVAIYSSRQCRQRDCPVAQPRKTTKAPAFRLGLLTEPGNFLLSHTLAHAVPSGLRGLTAVFGMGTGGSPSLRSPRIAANHDNTVVREPGY